MKRATVAARRTAARLELVLALAAFLLVAWYAATAIHSARASVADDAYITYQYGRNLAEGHGLRYNASDSQPTSGGSSLVHTLFAAAVETAHVDPLLATRLLSILCLLWTGALSGLVAARIARAPPGAGLLAGAWIALGLALMPETEVHLASGMETLLFLAVHATAVAWAALALERSGPLGQRESLAGAALLLLLPLVRPEGAVLALLYALAVSWSRGSGLSSGFRGARGLLALVAAGFALLTALHWAYYGVLLPNPYYVKSANRIFGSSGALLPGAGSSIEFALLRALPLLGCVAVLAGLRGVDARWEHWARWERWRRRAWLLVPTLLLLVLLARVIREMAGSFRYEYPLLAPFCLLLALGVLELRAWSRRAYAALLVVTGIALPLAFTPARSELAQRLAHPRSLATGWLRDEPPGNALARLGHDLARTGLGQSATILLSGAGQVPYFSRLRAIDWIGLNDTQLSGRHPLDLAEVWQYIERQHPDVVYSILPPAAVATLAGAPASAQDPNLQSALVQQFLGGRASELFDGWDRERVEEMFRREMGWVREHCEFAACYKLGSAWGGDWWLFVYVRRDSPHRERLLQELRASRWVDRESDLGAVFAFDPRLLGAAPR